MLQEKPEGKWIASFRRVLKLNGIEAGTSVAIVAESQSRPILRELSEIALYDLGATFFVIDLPTPEQSAPVPVRSTGASNAIANIRPVVEALKRVDVIVAVSYTHLTLPTKA